MRRYRNLKNWGQADLASASGIKIDTIRTAEQGRHTPRRDTAERYDEALGADGAVLRAFGYVTDAPADDSLSSLRAEVERLSRVVDRLVGAVGLTLDVDELPPSADVRGDAQGQ